MIKKKKKEIKREKKKKKRERSSLALLSDTASIARCKHGMGEEKAHGIYAVTVTVSRSTNDLASARSGNKEHS